MSKVGGGLKMKVTLEMMTVEDMRSKDGAGSEITRTIQYRAMSTTDGK